MPDRPSIPAKEIVGDFDEFTNFARQVMSVPRSAIQPTLDAEKEKRTSRAASRASGASPKQGD
jgi:hypothetical protein